MAQQKWAQVRGILYGAFFIYEQASCLYMMMIMYTQEMINFYNEQPVSKSVKTYFFISLGKLNFYQARKF